MILEKRERYEKVCDALERHLVFTSKFRKARHLVFIPYRPTFGAKWAWRGSTDRNERRWIIRRRLRVPITLSADSLRVGGIVLDRGVVQRVLQAERISQCNATTER